MNKSLFNDWEKTRLIEKERKHARNVKFYETFWFIFRIVVKVALALAVLASAVLSKASLLYITRKALIEDNTWVWMLIITSCVPCLFVWVDCLFKTLFDSHEKWPSWRIFLLVLGTETLNAAGTSLLIFQVLPKQDIIQSLLIMNTFSLVPSLLNIIFRKKSNSLETNRLEAILLKHFKHRLFRNINFKFEILLNLLAFVIQATVFALVFLPQFAFSEPWKLCIAIVLISASHWENFMDTYVIGLSKRKIEMISSLKNSIEFSRHPTLLITAAWKIAVIFLFAYWSHPSAFHLSAVSFQKDYNWLIIQVFISFACYYFSLVSCKLCMQRTSFALPLVLSFPVLLAIVMFLCKFLPVENFMRKEFINATCSLNYADHYLILVFAVLSWLAHLWVNRHVWTNVTHRMQRRRRLFVTPGYSNIFIEQQLMLNRRRRCPDDDEYQYSDELVETNQRETVMLYSCATMWHENQHEMLKLLTSIMRLDKDQSEKKAVKDHDPDYYDYQAHIFFDDAIKHENESTMLNSFVQDFIGVVSEAASFCYERKMTVNAPEKVETPYGGRLVYTLPAGNQMIVHLKDKAKIRIKKRWSQVMYMFYLIGFFNFDGFDEIMNFYEEKQQAGGESKRKESNKFMGFGNLLKNIDESTRKRLENTFLLTLDGDVEFRPEAVRLMVDKMKKHKKVGSVCGRVHPIGSGPMVWYQVFEYAVGHWLQKCAEQIFGTVMCSPGCFSLLRGSAVMDDHVLRTYAVTSTEASHYVQYDQGEDRWLSTLLIQQGYSIHYYAAACCFTYAPESFNEYYSQRRRWIPSTIANLLDFLNDYKHIIKINSKVSFAYVAYQLLILFASTIGPSTVLLLIADTFQFSFGCSVSLAYLIVLSPIIVFIVFCSLTKNDIQIVAAIVLSTLYSIIMVAVIIASLTRLASPLTINPSTAIFLMLLIVYATTGVLHPREFSCLFPGVLYFLSLPSAFVFLQIYALFNLNNVSWGTREVKEQASESGDQKANTGSSSTWIDDQILTDSPVVHLHAREHRFFNNLITEYLKPIVHSEEHKKKIIDDLSSLRNNCAFLYCLINAVWLALIFNLQFIQTRSISRLEIVLPIKANGDYIRYEPMSFIFVVLFIAMTIFQYSTMLWHRYKTALHLIYAAEKPKRVISAKIAVNDARENFF